PGEANGEAGDAPGGAPVEEISYDKVGTGRTYVEAGPGTFEVAASSEGRGYHIAVYACGEDVTEAGARDAAPEETEPQRSDPASSSSPAEQAALPLTTGLAEAPAEGPMRSADFGPVAAGTSVAGPGGLTHLPETGGAGLLGLVLGVLCFAGGTLAFALKARGRRREDG
ncbi:MAG: hypothetical protein M3522_09255, partial [Actinomycetota bacterium]|nr:hypothetical protein [Actinomycetota bacterium]